MKGKNKKKGIKKEKEGNIKQERKKYDISKQEGLQKRNHTRKT